MVSFDETLGLRTWEDIASCGCFTATHVFVGVCVEACRGRASVMPCRSAKLHLGTSSLLISSPLHCYLPMHHTLLKDAHWCVDRMQMTC